MTRTMNLGRQVASVMMAGSLALTLAACSQSEAGNGDTPTDDSSLAIITIPDGADAPPPPIPDPAPVSPDQIEAEGFPILDGNSPVLKDGEFVAPEDRIEATAVGEVFPTRPDSLPEGAGVVALAGEYLVTDLNAPPEDRVVKALTASAVSSLSQLGDWDSLWPKIEAVTNEVTDATGMIPVMFYQRDQDGWVQWHSRVVLSETEATGFNAPTREDVVRVTREWIAEQPDPSRFLVLE